MFYFTLSSQNNWPRWHHFLLNFLHVNQFCSWCISLLFLWHNILYRKARFHCKEPIIWDRSIDLQWEYTVKAGLCYQLLYLIKFQTSYLLISECKECFMSLVIVNVIQLMLLSDHIKRLRLYWWIMDSWERFLEEGENTNCHNHFLAKPNDPEKDILSRSLRFKSCDK